MYICALEDDGDRRRRRHGVAGDSEATDVRRHCGVAGDGDGAATDVRRRLERVIQSCRKEMTSDSKLKFRFSTIFRHILLSYIFSGLLFKNGKFPYRPKVQQRNTIWKLKSKKGQYTGACCMLLFCRNCGLDIENSPPTSDHLGRILENFTCIIDLGCVRGAILWI